MKAPLGRQKKKNAAHAAAKSCSSTNERQWQADLEEQRSIWSRQERKVADAMGNYMEKKCIDIKVEIAALELLVEPEEAEDCLRYILKHAKRKGSRIFEIFDTQEKKDHFVASRKEGSVARKVAKRVARRKLRRYSG